MFRKRVQMKSAFADQITPRPSKEYARCEPASSHILTKPTHPDPHHLTSNTTYRTPPYSKIQSPPISLGYSQLRQHPQCPHPLLACQRDTNSTNTNKNVVTRDAVSYGSLTSPEAALACEAHDGVSGRRSGGR
ncbi:hypothetical protein PILCRDRAFT_829401 [Piloderma croceum F 1598]|uniref:Uncharacterized protein n=1 Tax=Piloderma croceum (strain F 1598) TaxID=765440 RepID=A0A0C3AH37_PILCF|nr:hypothetical protein PILCRDRAFT_829401 [Piloderma croceum F 1598]